MKNLLKSYIFTGIVLIILGGFLLFRPETTLHFVIRLFGILLLVVGGVTILAYLFRRNSPETTSFSIAIGILEVLGGIILLVKQDFFVGIVPMVAGIIMMMGGIVSLYHAFTIRQYEYSLKKPSIASSLVTLILGLVILLNPVFISKIIVQLIGIGLLIEGATLLLSLSRKPPQPVQTARPRK